MKILMVGGGTLGSVTPLLAVAEELQNQKKKPEVSFWGTRFGPERQLVEAAGILFRSIPAGKLRRYWDLRNLLDLVVVKWAFWIALARLIHWRPSVVVGAGSFVQVPVMWAAWVLRIPIVIHQLDVRPSLANRLVAPFASQITVTFPESTKAFRGSAPIFHGREKLEQPASVGSVSGHTGSDARRVMVVGAPVRRAILAVRDLNPREARRHFGFTSDRPVLLILGGGTGAQAINELVRGALPELLEHMDVIHVTGRNKMQNAKHKMQNYRSFELLTDDLPSAYAAADLVVSRAGMGTISELAALGKPMVLIPMPGTHQTANAAALEAAGATIVWDQRELTSAEFARRTSTLLNDASRRQSLAARAVDTLPSGAAERIAAIIKSNLSA